MPQIDLRPDSDTVPSQGPPSPEWGTVPSGSDLFAVLNDEPDNDSTYVYGLGTEPARRIGFYNTFTDLPADADSVISMTLRMRHGLITLFESHISYSIQLDSDLIPGVYYTFTEQRTSTFPVGYQDHVIPGGPWPASDINQIYLVTVLNYPYVLGGCEWRITEYRLQVEYTTLDNMVNSICLSGSFKTAHNVGGSIPECD